MGFIYKNEDENSEKEKTKNKNNKKYTKDYLVNELRKSEDEANEILKDPKLET